jgi:hypothetical protein
MVPTAEAPMAFARHLALLILPSLFLLASPARADDLQIETDDVQIGTGLVCDTQQQVKRFVSIYDGDIETAVSTVNTEEHDPTACVIAAMAYVPGDPVDTAIHNDKMFHIVPVVVLGVVTAQGLQAITPAQFFSVVEVKGQDI